MGGAFIVARVSERIPTNQCREVDSPPGFWHRRLLRGAVLLAFSSLVFQPALAQGNDSRAWGYAFVGAGAMFSEEEREGVLRVGGGGEGLLFGGFGLGGELGYFSAFADRIGVLSLGVLGAFNRDQATVPFVTGGYTVFFGSGEKADHGVYVGGGINRWIGDHWGIRIEGREQVVRTQARENDHVLEGRVAILLR